MEGVERERRPVRPKSTAPLVIPGLIATVLIGVAVVAGILNRQELAPEPLPREQRERPFAGLPPDVPPSRRGKDAAPATLELAPSGLKAEAVWVAAVELAREGEALFDETLAAKNAGQHALANEKGNLARAKFDQALESTALFEEELLTKYGDRDQQVRDIKRERSRWFERLDWLLKSVGR
jgi:hypothetical protein